MNTLKLFLDITGKQLRAGPADRQVFQLPWIAQNDVIPIELFLIQATPEAGISSPFAYVTDSALSVKIGIVTPHPSAATVHCSADLTLVGGSNPAKWTGVLSVGTLGSLLTGAVTSATAKIEVQLYDASTGQTTTALQIDVALRADGLKPATPPPVAPPDSYVTATQAGATFAKKIGDVGDTLTLTSADGTKRVILYVDNDGNFHADAEAV